MKQNYLKYVVNIVVEIYTIMEMFIFVYISGTVCGGHKIESLAQTYESL